MRSKFKWIFTLLLALSMQFSFAQEKTVTGVVSDESGPLPGANVVVKGTTRSTQTDFDGKYSIKAKQGEVLVVSFVGMQETSVTVGASNVVNAKLSGVTLNEVVIQTNFGFFKKDANKIAAAVSVVAGEEFTAQAPSLSFTNALQGKAAGVQVTARNGQPGGGAYLTVRGNVSITGGYSGAVYVVDGAYVSETEATSIAASDIENVTILKDAASTVVFGGRGGNGVVVITTKRGKLNSKAKFEVSSTFGYSQRIKENGFHLMNAAQKIGYEQALGDGPTASMTPAEVATSLSLGHSWEDTLLRNGAQQNINFSASGGNDKMSNYFSLGYNENAGIIKSLDGYKRITAAFSSDYQATDWFKLGVSVRGSYEKNDIPRDRYNAQNPFFSMYAYNPYEAEFDTDLTTGQLILDANGHPTYNLTQQGFSVGEALLTNPEQQRYFRSYARAYGELKLLKGLVFNSAISLDYERYQREYFVKPGSILDGYVGDANNPGSKTDNGWDNLDVQWVNSLNYKFKLGESHNFNVTALYDYNSNNFRAHSQSRKGFIGDFPTLGTVPTAASVSHTQQAAYGVLGNLDYDYQGKYLGSYYAREDYSSLLGLQNRHVFAQGASLGWVLTKENFFKPSNALGFLKLRGSYGTLNSTNGIARYDNLTNFTSTPYGTASGTVLLNDQLGNPLLGFEQAKKLDLGFEARLFKDRISLTASYFKDKRTNFIFGDFAPLTDFGLTINAGDWTAKGYELELKAFAIRKEDMNLSFYVNAAQYDRKIDRLNQGGDDLIRGFTINRVGNSPDSFYLVRYAGVDSTNGDALYYDKDGNITNVFSSDDEVLVKGKSQYAKYEGGFGMEFDYKGFDLSTDFVFKQGNYIYNLRKRDLYSDGINITQNQDVAMLDYWTPTNTNASQPAPTQMSGVDTNQDSTRFLEDGSYIRFRNLNFGYTFGKKLLRDLPIDKVRIYTQIQNLYTWTKFTGDPEIGIGNAESGTAIPGQYAGYSYPSTKTFLFGLTVNF